MPGYRLLQHKDFEESLEGLSPSAQRKAVWAQVLLGARGRTPVVKGTMGRNARWRRTPVQGNHYYMWWIPQSESGLSNGNGNGNGVAGERPPQTNTILVHSVRHHDETDQPINLGALSDYRPIPLDTLDPRYDEQRAVSRGSRAGQLAVATIKGLPGSGKTVALLYLLRDLISWSDGGQILYVTYTARLKRAAREFVESQYSAHTGLPLDTLNERLRIITLNDLVAELTGVSTYIEPFAELREFYAFLERQNPAELGLWRRYPRTLFTEIRAYLLGQDFPEDYGWAQENLGGGGIDLLSYAEERNLDLDEAEIAYQLARRMRETRFFRDQLAARRALRQLSAGQPPAWLGDLRALVIDEVQDLTLIQIALLTELMRQRAEMDGQERLAFVVAGDESQIVQPSGFDWGMTKYMIGDQTGVWPQEFEFRHQRRAPDNLAALIDNSWNFYAYLPKKLRPSARRERMLFDEEPGEVLEGQIFICPPPDESSPPLDPSQLAADFADFSAGDGADDNVSDGAKRLDDLLAGLENVDAHWTLLMAALADRPGRALVDLSEELRGDLPASAQSMADEIVYLPREIKGLERQTIIIQGMDAVYRRARDLCVDRGEGNIPRFEARRLFDEIRVAVSRSTYRLVLLEEPDAEVLQELELDQTRGVSRLSWPDLILALQTEEMSEIEAIEGYLLEVEDLAERGKWEQAVTRNRRAYRLAARIGDRALQREADRQHVGVFLQRANALLRREAWREAYDANRTARDLAAVVDEDDQWRRVDGQLAEIQRLAAAELQSRVDEANALREANRYEQAYQAARRAQEMVAMLPAGEAVQRANDALADAAWSWAAHLLDVDDEAAPRQMAELLDESAAIMARQGDETGASALRLLRDRYRKIPQRRDLTDQQIREILDYAHRYLAIMEPLDAGAGVYVHVRRWLLDTFACLEEHFTLYYAWASTAQALGEQIGDPSYRPLVLRLEQRLETIFDRAGALGSLWDDDLDLKRFRALVAGVHGEHEEASMAWERLDEPEAAADQARLAGDPERAYNLRRQAKLPISEELSTSVKFLRLLEQVEGKHDSLSPAERATLARRMEELKKALGGATGDERPTTDDQ